MKQEVIMVKFEMCIVSLIPLYYTSVSLYFKQKLRAQYVNALQDAKKELV